MKKLTKEEINQYLREFKPMVYGRVSRYKIRDYDTRQDVIQAGLLGLWHGLKRYDRDKGVLVYTYIRPWVSSYMQREVRKINRAVEVPGYVMEVQRQIAKVLSESPELRDGLLKNELLRQYPNTGTRVADRYLDQFLAQPSDVPIGSRAGQVEVVDHTISPDDAYREKEQKQILHRLVDKLPEKRKMVIHFRLQEFSLQQIADRMELSRERIRQIEKRAKQDLRELYEAEQKEAKWKLQSKSLTAI